jgi:hypothetical protein
MPPFKPSRLVVISAVLSVNWFISPVHGACTAVIPELKGATIQIDGQVDPAWDSAEWHAINQVLAGSNPSADAFSATWSGYWDSVEDRLFLIIEVVDTSGISRDSGGNTWEDDNIEIYLDGDYSRMTNLYDNQNDYQFRFMPNAQGGEAYYSGSPFSGSMLYRTEILQNGYRLEVAISLASVGIEKSGATQSIPFGLEFQVTDDPDGGNRDNKLGWCAANDVAWKDPSSFGTGELEVTNTNPVEVEYAVRVANSPGGSIELTPGAASYQAGSMVQVKAVADSGYRFVGWRGDLSGNRNPRSLHVNSEKDIAALFVQLSQGKTVFAMNAGGPEYTDADGIVYQANNYSNPRSGSKSHRTAVSGTDDPLLYSQYQEAADKLIYSIPLTSGVYEVDVMWAARDGVSNGMEVSLAGELVEQGQPGIDVQFAAGGLNKALVRTYRVSLSDDFLRLVLFRSGNTNPFIHAIRVREMEILPQNQPPHLETVNVPGVVRMDLTIPPEAFESGFLDPERDLLAGIEVTSLPLYGSLFLDGQPVARGQWIAYDELGELLYRSARQIQGRDFWHWRGHDGNHFSDTAAAVHIFLRAGQNRVNNQLVATWDTYQWPFFAYYPEREGGLVGLDGIARDGNSCGPTARSHVNYHWKYPLTNLGTIWFQDSGTLQHYFPYSFSPYNYHAMPPSVSSQTPVNEVPQSLARLMVDNHTLGVDVYGSGANAWEAMPAFQGFDDSAKRIQKADLSDAQWIKTLKQELNMGRLLMLDGRSDVGGHWWIVSGYDSNDRFYAKLNYGNIEGYYPADNFAGYYKDLAVIAGMQPEELGNMLLSSPSIENPEILSAGEPILIEWSAARAETVDLLYSLNNGDTWELVRWKFPAERGWLWWRTPPISAPSIRFRVVNTDGEYLETYNDYADSASCALTNPPAGDWLKGGGDVFSSFKGIGWHRATGPNTIRTLGGLNLVKLSDELFYHEMAGWLIAARHFGGLTWFYSPVHGWLGTSDLTGGYVFAFTSQSWQPISSL